MQGREAFQEIDYAQVFGGLAKWAAQIDDAHRMPELVTRAFHVAMSGRPGSGRARAARRRAARRGRRRRLGAGDAHRRASRRRRARAAARAARRRGTAAGDPRRQRLGRGRVRAMRRFAERNALPVACSFRRQALFDNRHPHYAGDLGLGPNPALAERVRDADLILAVGARLSEVPTGGYTLIEAPRPRQRSCTSTPIPTSSVASSARARDQRRPGRVRARARRHATGRGAALERVDRRCTRRLRSARSQPEPRGVARPRARGAVSLDERLPDDAIVCNGAGNYNTWLHRFFQYKRFGTQLGPTARRDGLRFPGGDRGEAAPSRPHRRRVRRRRLLLMSGHELATAVQYGMQRDRAGDQQRDVRHDPHAPGAPLSRPRHRDRPASTPTSSRTRAPTARTARWSNAPRISRRRSTRRWPPASRRCSSCGPIPTRSRRARPVTALRGAQAQRPSSSSS